ncbi:MAG: hypothetical protein GY807_11405 [Gammaproteobacteria bacterium]|nr:hypothetical protein [Gammaproteobacteria bacterium]
MASLQLMLAQKDIKTKLEVVFSQELVDRLILDLIGQTQDIREIGTELFNLLLHWKVILDLGQSLNDRPQH